MGGDTGKDRSKIKYSLSWRRAQKLPVSSKRAPQLPISQFPPEHNNTLIMSAINTNEGKKKKPSCGIEQSIYPSSTSPSYHCDRSEKETKLHYIKPAFNTEIHADNITAESLSAGSHPSLPPDRESVMRLSSQQNPVSFPQCLAFI